MRGITAHDIICSRDFVVCDTTHNAIGQPARPAHTARSHARHRARSHTRCERGPDRSLRAREPVPGGGRPARPGAAAAARPGPVPGQFACGGAALPVGTPPAAHVRIRPNRGPQPVRAPAAPPARIPGRAARPPGDSPSGRYAAGYVRVRLARGARGPRAGADAGERQGWPSRRVARVVSRAKPESRRVVNRSR